MLDISSQDTFYLLMNDGANGDYNGETSHNKIVLNTSTSSAISKFNKVYTFIQVSAHNNVVFIKIDKK